MAYDFTRFSSQSFERFVQALAMGVCGELTQIYGAGADGGREATFEGRCRIGATEWDGYVVFQAKHREHLGTPDENAKWLIEQIDGEMAKFADKRRGLRMPDYYVLGSNVRLSATAKNGAGEREGGVDKITRYLSEKAHALGIRDIAVWHQDNLAAMLDTRPEIRTAFDFWVQPSDVLAAILRKLSGPNRTDVLADFLAEGLRHSREIKTRDVGQAIGRTVNLEEVFVDLPVQRTSSMRIEVPVHQAGALLEAEDLEALEAIEFEEITWDDVYPAAVVSQLLREAADVLDHAPGQRNRGEGGRCERPLSGRIVLLGGPGQGKSTVGQFVAQLYRARLLAGFPERHAPETQAAIDAVLDRARAEGISLAGPMRYPFHIELPRYADRLSAARTRDETISILTYMALRVTTEAEEDVTPATLSEWLGKMPSIVVLDGLDEVPASGNRADVILAIEQLMDRLTRLGADCLVLVTSRPQGYRDELQRDLWSHWQLAALEPDHALRLADNVGTVIVADAVRRREIIQVLSDAAGEATTAPLMTSPLQVMLLFQLVATHNNIPKDRWTLFQRHYETLRDREISKGGSSGGIIREFRQQIDAVHADAGYLLHLRAETTGNADAHLALDELSSLIKARLERDEFPGDLSVLADRIVSVATERLVFLRSQVEGQVAFDVRSLQEFMAAVRITASPEAKIVERLTALAGRSHWSHVLRITASKIFGSSQHEVLRDGLIGMLDSLDRGDRSEDDRLIRTGSRIALQLLSDGAASSVPAFERKLSIRAANLIEAPDRAAARELAVLLDFSLLPSLEPRILAALNGGGRIERTWAFRYLLRYLNFHGDSHYKTVEHVLLSHWPDQPSEVFRLIDSPALIPSAPAIRNRLRMSQFASTPSEVQTWLGWLTDDDGEETNARSAVAIVRPLQPLRTLTLPLLVPDSSSTNFMFTFNGLASATTVVELMSEPTPVWHLTALAGVFSANPSAEAASRFIDVFSQHEHLYGGTQLSLPWLLDALITGAGEELLQARRAALLDGAYGRPQDWQEAENRWVAGMDADSIVAAALAPPLPCGVRLGLPRILGQNTLPRRRAGPSTQKALETLVHALPEAPWAVAGLLKFMEHHDCELSSNIATFIATLPPGALNIRSMRNAAVNALVSAAAKAKAASAAADLLATILASHPYTFVSSRRFDDAAAAVNSHPNLRGLIPAMAQMAVRWLGGYRHDGRALPALGEPSAPFRRLQAGDTPDIRGGVALIKVLERAPDASAKQTIDALMAWPRAPIEPVLSRLMRGSHADSELAALIARAVLVHAQEKWAEGAYSTLQQFLEAMPSDLQKPDSALPLQLPKPLDRRGAT